MSNLSEQGAALADDLCWGIKEIASVIRRTPRQTHWLLSGGKLPAKKIGAFWVASRQNLRRALIEAA